MAWYTILFIVVFGVFLLKSIISWIAGDVDLDVDFDGDTDFDVSGLLSFKGIIHFIMGFSSVLNAYAYCTTRSFTTTITFEWYVYVIAILTGAGVMVLLYYIYKSMMKLNQSVNSNPNFEGASGKVYINEGNGDYQILIDTPQGSFKKIARSENENLKAGDSIIVKKYDINTKEIEIC